MYTVNIYRPEKSKKGPNTVEQQHINALHEIWVKVTKPRKTFVKDLLRTLKDLLKQTEKIFLAGDLNEKANNNENTNKKYAT